MLRRILVATGVLPIIAAIAAFTTRIPPDFDPASESYAMLQRGAVEVVTETLQLVDESRYLPDPLVEGQTLPRSFEVTLWRPADGALSPPLQQPMPLVLYSHGIMSTADEGKHIGEHLASHGYTVAAPNFPLTNFSNGKDVVPADVVNQPADISFLLNELLARAADAEDVLYQRIDASRIAAVGMSMGGMTTHMLGYDPVRHEARLAALVAVAAPSAMFTRKYFSTRQVPYLMIASPQDAFIDYEQNALPILEKIDDATLLTIDGGSHAGYSDQARWLRWFSNPDSIGCYQVASTIEDETDGDGWYAELGSVEEGYIEPVDMQVCQADLEKAMNPIRQTQFELAAVWSFLQCQFVGDDSERFCRYLQETMPAEHDEISYRQSD